MHGSFMPSLALPTPEIGCQAPAIVAELGDLEPVSGFDTPRITPGYAGSTEAAGYGDALDLRRYTPGHSARPRSQRQAARTGSPMSDQASLART